ncbi:MAG: exo-alpha-sialidase [Planctomycetaceae bacterium]
MDQQAAQIIVPANDHASGFWFGGGNMGQSQDGALYVVGRFRNAGDSRVGVAAGTRGLELAVFRSADKGESFDKVVSLSKADLNVDDQTVLSIEGTALRMTSEGVELFVSTEKDAIGYPNGLESFLKPGTGVWTIDKLSASSIEELHTAKVQPLLASDDPEYLHIKDPFVYEHNDVATLLFCSHPFCWSSSNTGYCDLDPATDSDLNHTFFPRGTTWDVAMTRGTAVVDVPRLGAFADKAISLVFYDGGECLRDLDEHDAAVKRPRGYSCEELGGLAWMPSGSITTPQRLSKYEPMFLSPHGTACSRYVDVLTTSDGMYATWQQSQPDGSQPLVMNFLSNQQIESALN